MWVLQLASAVFVLSAQAGDGVPSALEIAEHVKLSFETGRVEWSDVRHDRAFDRGFERFNTSRFSMDGSVHVNNGDAEGVLARNPDGKPAFLPYQSALHSLLRDNVLWIHHEGASDADTRPRGLSVDIRTLGMSYRLGHSPLTKTLWTQRSDIKEWTFDEKVEGAVHIVNARRGNERRTWWIDTARGWNPVRVAKFIDGELRNESRSELKLSNGTWFPVRVDYYHSKHAGGREPYQTVRVSYARLNAPDDPLFFGPADIGIEAGTLVKIHGENHQVREILMWDGENLVKQREFAARVRAGEISFGPNLSRKMAKFQAMENRPGGKAKTANQTSAAAATQPAAGQTADRRKFETAWERYTREFIVRYSLDDTQQQKAWSICKTCQEKGREYVRRHKNELDNLRTRVEELSKSTNRGDNARRDQVRRRLAEKLQPIDDIFENQLRPRLHKLPTRKQRAAVEKAEKKAP